MIYITGDIHGRPDILDEILKILKPGDILIVVGDFGVGFFDSYCSEEKFYDYIAKMQITLIFIDGNHEVFPKLNGYAFNHKGYYWDFDDNLSNLQRGQTPFSPATILFLQLHARLLQLKDEGGEAKNIAAIKRKLGIKEISVLPYSSLKNEGRSDLLDVIGDSLLE